MYMRLKLSLCSLLLGGLCLLGNVHSARAQEVQVAFDVTSDTSQSGRIFTIYRDLRDEIALFPDKAGFESARLFKQASGSYTLEISVIEAGKTVRRSSTLDSLEVAKLRADVIERVGHAKPSALVDQSGRSHFLWTTALASFLYYGPAIAANFGEDAGASATAYLVGGGVGFFVPYLLTMNSKMSDGMAAGARVGAVLGIVHSSLAFGAVVNFDDDLEYSTFAGVTSLASIAEMGLGVALADKYDIPAGRMNLIGVGGVFGTGIGFESSLMVAWDGITPAFVTGMGLAGSLSGMYLANEVAAKTKYTTGDAKAMMMGGLTGNFLATALVVEAGPNTELTARLTGGVLAGSTLVACYATHYWLGSRDLTDAQGNLVILGTLGGGLIGLGLSATQEDFDSGALITALGSTAGFSIMMATLGHGTEDKGAIETREEQNYGTIESSHRSLLDRVDVSLNPLALGMAAMKSDLPRGTSLKPPTVAIASVTLTM